MVDKIGKVDLLMSPIGNHSDFTPKQVGEIIEEMEPSVVVPMMYNIPGLKLKNPELAELLKVLGAKDHKKEDRLDIKKTPYPAGHIDVIELSPLLGK